LVKAPNTTEMGHRISLLDLEYAELEELLIGWGQPAYRARQLWTWIYVRLAEDFQAMTDLPLTLRDRLSHEASIQSLCLLAEATSSDASTRKALLALPDGNTLETVLMHYDDRHTACISAQVGCAVGCPFCATGQGGLVRNLSTGEIVGQVLFWARRLARLRERLSNVVIMGMGEPLANYEATWGALVRLMDEGGVNLGARHITVSTAGLVPGIYRLAAEDTQVRLAISLHAPTDTLRDQLVPLNRRYDLAQLMTACHAYQKQTGRRISFEYVLIEGLNDSPAQARQLARLLEGLLAHVNLIPLNPIPEFPYSEASPGQIRAFRDELSRWGVSHTLRQRRGGEIQAGCGQLRAHQTTRPAGPPV
jgi:23S rRNA (adenine2503-C2)-methyltransferase